MQNSSNTPGFMRFEANTVIRVSKNVSGQPREKTLLRNSKWEKLTSGHR